eukprot:TRINITY_DN7222_c0_g1_i1.p1 TRINITY_DN7222_c0_g1~~TRINITY_DN7222_c0_g1_i1.p1  ORF type:complete len:147 (+),score=34.98 TRINITY_DN7222_c0_g1_i1:39-443(+)
MDPGKGYRQTKRTDDSNRQQLFGDSKSMNANKAKVEQMYADARAGTKSIENSILTTNDTILVANDTRNRIRGNRERLQQVDGKLDAVHDEAARGERSMRMIWRRAITNKIVYWLIVIILVATIIFTVYWKLARK